MAEGGRPNSSRQPINSRQDPDTPPVSSSQQQQGGPPRQNTNNRPTASRKNGTRARPSQQNLCSYQATDITDTPYPKTTAVLVFLRVITLTFIAVYNQRQAQAHNPSLALMIPVTEQFIHFSNDVQGVLANEGNHTGALTHLIRQQSQSPPESFPPQLRSLYQALLRDLTCRPINHCSTDLDNSLYELLYTKNSVGEILVKYMQEESTKESATIIDNMSDNVIELLAFYEHVLKVYKDVKIDIHPLRGELKKKAEVYIRTLLTYITNAIQELQLFGDGDIADTVRRLVDTLGMDINDQWQQALVAHLYFTKEDKVKCERSHHDRNNNGDDGLEIVEAISESWIQIVRQGKAVTILTTTNIPNSARLQLLLKEVEKGNRFIILYKTAGQDTDEMVSVGDLTKESIPIFKIVVNDNGPVVTFVNRQPIFEQIYKARPASGVTEQPDFDYYLTWEEVVTYLLDAMDEQYTSITSSPTGDEYQQPRQETQQIRNQETHEIQIPTRFAGMEVENPAGNGNCQFAALSHQLRIQQNIEVSPQQLRAQAVHYLSTNVNIGDGADRWDAFLLSGEKRGDYLERMKKNGQWGDQHCLQALANIYKIQIVVLSSIDMHRDRVFSVQGDDLFHRSQPFLVLGHIPEYHYMSLDIDESEIVSEMPINRVQDT